MATVDFLVNMPGTDSSGNQDNPAAAVLTSGYTVVAWESPSYDSGNGNGIVFTMLDPQGEKIGGSIRANITTAGEQSNPDVAALAGGGFVLVWQSAGQDIGGEGIYARIYDASGVAQSYEIRINLTTAGDQTDPSVIGLADGGFAVAFTSPDADGSGIRIERFDALGARAGAPILVNTVTAGNQAFSDISALPDGGFVVAWQSGSVPTHIMVQRYDADSNPVGPQATADNLNTNHNELQPAIAVLQNGDYVVTWYDNNTGGVFARHFLANGSAQGDMFQVSDPAENPGTGRPDIAATADGGFVIVWTDFSSPEGGEGYFAQRYDADGNTLGEIQRALSFPNLDFSNDPTVVGLADGGFATFAAATGFESGSDIIGAIHDQATALADVLTLTAPGRLDGLAGNDLLIGSGGTDVLNGGAGIDVLRGENGNDVLILGRGAEGIAQTAYGGNGNDEIRDGDHAARLYGGDHTDRLLGRGGNDSLYGGNGNDLLNGGGDDDYLDGGQHKDTLRGEGGNDILDGGQGLDRLFGGDGDDTMDGGGEADRMHGGAGDDVMAGGLGADQFLYTAKNFGDDVITDWGAGDNFRVSTSVAANFNAITVEQDDGNVVLVFGGGSVVLLGAAGQIDASDFSFF